MTATLSEVHHFFCDGFTTDENGKKVPVNGYTITNFRNDWSKLSVEEKQWFKDAVAEVLAS